MLFHRWVCQQLALPDPALITMIVDQAETVSRRVDKFAELMQSVWLSRNDYERRVKLVSKHSILLPYSYETDIASSCPFGNSSEMVGKYVFRYLHGRQESLRRLHHL